MKITILGPAHPFRGGIAALNEQLARQFISEGHEVNIVSFTVQYPQILFPGKTQFNDFEVDFDFPVSREINSVNPVNWIKTGRKIRALSPDLVIVRFWIPFMGMALGTICREIMKNGRTKIIALTDNLIPHEKRIGDQILIKYFTGSVHGFIAMSKQVLSDISKYEFKKPKKYTPHPVYDHYGEIEEREIALGKLSLDPQNRYILFFGIIRDYKGLDLLLHAFSDSYFADNNIKLIVAGEFYTDEDRYMKIISEMNLKNQVILRTEYIPNSEVPDYFNAADIIVQPYKTATQSGVTQIGYHFNTPMLVTNVGGLAEIIPHMKAGYVVEPNPEAISGALKDYFSNRRMSEFKANITKEKERFSWDKMTSAFYQLMNELKNGEH